MPPSLARRVLEVADEIARLASRQASDLKPFEIGNALERLRQVRAEVEAVEEEERQA